MIDKLNEMKWNGNLNIPVFQRRMMPVIGFKISDVIEGVDSDYTRAWAWRATPKNEHNASDTHATLGDEQGGRFATEEELRA